MNRACGDFRLLVPQRLVTAWQSGSQEEWEGATSEVKTEVSEAASQLWSAARQLTVDYTRSAVDVASSTTRLVGEAAKRLYAGDQEQGADLALGEAAAAGAADVSADAGGARPPAVGTRVAAPNLGGGDSASSAPGGAEREAQQTPRLGLFEKGALEIKKYLFADEGKEKGTVKVYIQAQELEAVDGFRDVHVEFQERSISARAVSKDGRVWVLRAGPLWGPVRAGECRYSLSSTGHKVSITLKKADTSCTWHRLTEVPGKGPTPTRDARDFI